MARTIDEIKNKMAQTFMANDTLADAYSFEQGADFDSAFSKVSIESIILYVISACIWALETLFDKYKVEMQEIIDNQRPHRIKWYRDKVLNFMVDKTLIADSDIYDTSTMTEAQINAAKVVKHAVAVESADASILTIKVAGESAGTRQPLTSAQETQLAAYIAEIKDAGVRINLVNISPDVFNCAVDIYYDPMLLPENVQSACTDAIENYIANLTFNGTYSNMALIDTLQAVEGVKVAEFKSASSQESGVDAVVQIDGIKVPAAGYFQLDTATLNMIAYEQ